MAASTNTPSILPSGTLSGGAAWGYAAAAALVLAVGVEELPQVAVPLVALVVVVMLVSWSGWKG